jgi:hypothetical protein
MLAESRIGEEFAAAHHHALHGLQLRSYFLGLLCDGIFVKVIEVIEDVVVKHAIIRAR